MIPYDASPIAVKWMKRLFVPEVRLEPKDGAALRLEPKMTELLKVCQGWNPKGRGWSISGKVEPSRTELLEVCLSNHRSRIEHCCLL